MWQHILDAVRKISLGSLGRAKESKTISYESPPMASYYTFLQTFVPSCIVWLQSQCQADVSQLDVRFWVEIAITEVSILHS